MATFNVLLKNGCIAKSSISAESMQNFEKTDLESLASCNSDTNYK